MDDKLIKWSDEECLEVVSDLLDNPDAPQIITCAVLGVYVRTLSVIVATRNMGSKSLKVMNHDACAMLAKEICEVVGRCLDMYLEKCGGQYAADASIMGFVGAQNEAVVNALRRMAGSN